MFRERIIVSCAAVKMRLVYIRSINYTMFYIRNLKLSKKLSVRNQISQYQVLRVRAGAGNAIRHELIDFQYYSTFANSARFSDPITGFSLCRKVVLRVKHIPFVYKLYRQYIIYKI